MHGGFKRNGNGGKRTAKSRTPRVMPRAKRISPELQAWAKMPRRKRSKQNGLSFPYAGGVIDPFNVKRNLYKPPPGVVPDGSTSLAMDDNINAMVGWAGNALASVVSEGLTFFGYAFLSELAQRPEYRRIVETISNEMIRKWIRISAKGDEEDKGGRVAEVGEFFEEIKVREHFQTCANYDGYFGRGHLFLDIGQRPTADWRDELKTDIGDGRNAATRHKVAKGFFHGIQPIEPVWCYPTSYDSINPLKKTWYNPDHWFVMGTEIHASRFLKFVGRPVPDLLKPAYMFGGLALTQMAKPYVDIFLETRQSIADLIHSFSVFWLQTDLSTVTQLGVDQLKERIDLFNDLRDNKGLMALNFGSEELGNIAVPLGTLDQLQAQAQEHICCWKGTLIETQRGQIAIENVTKTDRVMTRKGYAPVAWAGCTGKTKRLVEITTKNSVIRVTEDHPIYLPEKNDFVAARDVRLTDKLSERFTFAGEIRRNCQSWKDAASHVARTAKRLSALLSRCCSVRT
jgi:hypothetical protein